jgi:hypothetical protein
MIPLASSYKDHGQTFTLIRREGDVCMFSNATRSEFEVFRVRHAKAGKLPSGRSYPDREAIPPASAWGVDAYTCVDQARADYRFAELRNTLPEPIAIDTLPAVLTLPANQNEKAVTT